MRRALPLEAFRQEQNARIPAKDARHTGIADYIVSCKEDSDGLVRPGQASAFTTAFSFHFPDRYRTMDITKHTTQPTGMQYQQDT